MEADECFHALSYSDGPAGGTGKRFLDKDHMSQAVEDMLQKWDISLEEEGDAAFKKNHFEPTWSKFQKDDKVSYDDTQKFLAALLKKAD